MLFLLEGKKMECCFFKIAWKDETDLPGVLKCVRQSEPVLHVNPGWGSQEFCAVGERSPETEAGPLG